MFINGDDGVVPSVESRGENGSALLVSIGGDNKDMSSSHTSGDDEPVLSDSVNGDDRGDDVGGNFDKKFALILSIYSIRSSNCLFARRKAILGASIELSHSKSSLSSASPILLFRSANVSDIDLVLS